MMRKKIGFVGLGTMGFPMAVNLKKAGFEVIGYDANKRVYEKAGAAGITMVQTLGEVAAKSDEAMISMVRDYAQNVDIIFGENGLLSERSKGKTIIVMSTLDPDSMNELGKKVEEESHLKLISAAVSGGASGAQAGTLSIMTSGSEDIVKSFQPYFDSIGSNTFYYGDKPGNSQVAKLVNNMILGITMNAVAEGIKLGNHYNLREQDILNLLKVSTGDSWVVRNWSDVSEWSADTAFLTVLLKDLKAIFFEGIKHNVPLPFNALSATILFNSMGKEKPETL
jgi:3-hydroxyisobutyrate dehydrogenase-like beta-hydroxyacid dehydrogenase